MLGDAINPKLHNLVSAPTHNLQPSISTTPVVPPVSQPKAVSVVGGADTSVVVPTADEGYSIFGISISKNIMYLILICLGLTIVYYLWKWWTGKPDTKNRQQEVSFRNQNPDDEDDSGNDSKRGSQEDDDNNEEDNRDDRENEEE